MFNKRRKAGENDKNVYGRHLKSSKQTEKTSVILKFPFNTSNDELDKRTENLGLVKVYSNNQKAPKISFSLKNLTQRIVSVSSKSLKRFDERQSNKKMMFNDEIINLWLKWYVSC